MYKFNESFEAGFEDEANLNIEGKPNKKLDLIFKINKEETVITLREFTEFVMYITDFSSKDKVPKEMKKMIFNSIKFAKRPITPDGKMKE
jgi:hypothetical protein